MNEPTHPPGADLADKPSRNAFVGWGALFTPPFIVFDFNGAVNPHDLRSQGGKRTALYLTQTPGVSASRLISKLCTPAIWI